MTPIDGEYIMVEENGVPLNDRCRGVGNAVDHTEKPFHSKFRFPGKI